MESNPIKIISYESQNFPLRLKKIKYPPKEIYYKGNPDILKNKYILAVVGTRNMTHYGKQVLKSLIPEIAKQGIVIVSGLARGVDIMAHKLTLESGGKAVAVLAGGIDKIYPSEHTLFSEEIIKTGGLLLSENCPGTSYLKQFFPARNRIISGLSDAVLLVEAKRKSGALITAKFAFSQNRKVLAVPGSILSGQSQGINDLFNKGALPVQTIEDIFKILYGWKRRRKIKTQNNTSNNLSNLSREEKQILEHIPFDKAILLNTIIRETMQPTAKVTAIMTQLEIIGIVESSDGGYIRLS